MAYGQKYHLSFTNQINEDYTIYFMRKDYSGGSTALTGSGQTLTIRSFNNDDDRFAPILSKEAIIDIDIRETQALGITDFLAVEDDDWNIVIYKQPGEPPIFNGFLVVEDSSQPLHDRPLQLHLRASDGLPLLKNVPLKMSDGSDFVGLNNITDYIGHILYYINPDASFRVYFDIFHASMDTDDCPLEQTQIDCKVFEKSETVFLDSYTVLEMICNDFQLRCFYENGMYHVVSLRQYTKDTFNWWQFSVVSDVVTFSASSLSEVNIAPVGKNELIKFINKDAIIFYKVASKSVKKTFSYNIPRELVCNQAIRKGVAIPALNGVDYDAFALDCWTHQIDPIIPGPPDPTLQAYVRNDYDLFNYNKDKFIALPSETGNYYDANLLSSEFYVDAGDLISFAIDTRSKFSYSVSGPSHVAYWVFLRGDDGTNWFLGFDAPSTVLEWIQSDVTFSFYGGVLFDPGVQTDWQTVQAEPNKIPVSGTIQIVLTSHTRVELPNESWFKNIQIIYTPYIQGSTRPILGDINIYSQNLKINRTVDETVNISDSPKKIIKGALHVNNLLATPEWFRLGITESLRFTQQMALLKYHFAFVQFQKIEGTLKGLSLLNNNLNIPGGFLPQYSLTDLNSPTLRYILTSLDINYLSGHWHAVLVECQLNGPTTFDTYDFTYLFE